MEPLVSPLRYRLAHRDLRDFFSQFNLMFQSGIPLVDSLEALGSEDTDLGLVVSETVKNLTSGQALETAFAQASSSFDALIVGLLKVGRTTGMLGKCLEQIALRCDERFQRWERLKSALTYPLGIITLAVVCCLVISWILLPELGAVLGSFGGTPPWPTRVLLAISEYRLLLFNLILLPLLGLSFVYRTNPETVRREGKKALANLPILSRMFLAEAQSALARDLSLSLNAGISLNDTLKMLSQTLESESLREAMANLSRCLEQGGHLETAIKEEEAIHTMVGQSLVVGMEVGNMTRLLDASAKAMAEEQEYQTEKFLSLLEPAVMTILGLMTGFVVLASLLPIYDVIGRV
jgi:type II secretory pathway component PulF